MEILEVHAWQLFVVSNSCGESVQLVDLNGWRQWGEDNVTVQHRVLWEDSSMNTIEKEISESLASKFLPNTNVDESNLGTLYVDWMYCLEIAT